MIKLLERDEINDKKWNGCLHFGFNGLPYGYSWYLDIVADQWKGLVLDDYEAVFPLVWRKKWGISYLHQPNYSQQHGIYSLDPLPDSMINEFYQSIPEEFRYIDIQVNAENWSEQAGFEIEKRPNYVLDLYRPYEVISASYSGSVKRNLKRADKNELKITNQVKPEAFADFYAEHTAPLIKDFSDKRYYMLMRLAYNSAHYNTGFIAGVKNKSDELIATGFFIFNQKIIINLAPATSDEGRSCGAMSMLIDYIIRVNEDKPRILDFEGSSIRSIAKFFKGFGAVETSYLHIKCNKLPWYAKLLKN